MSCFPVGDNQDDLVSGAWWGGRGLVAERKLWAALTTQEVGTGTPRDLCLLPRLSSAAATPRCVSGGPTLTEREALWKTARVRDALPSSVDMFLLASLFIIPTCIPSCLLLLLASKRRPWLPHANPDWAWGFPVVLYYNYCMWSCWGCDWLNRFDCRENSI